MQLARQYAKTMSMEAAATVGENQLFVFAYLHRLLRVLAMLAIWRTLLPNNRQESGMSLGQILTYTLISEVFADLLSCRSKIEDAWFNGSITTRYLRPYSLFHQFSSEMFGRVAVNAVLFSLPLLLLAPLIGVNPLPTNLHALMLFIPSVVAAVSVGLALEYLITGLGIAAHVHPYAMNNVRSAVTTVVSGAFLPLVLLPYNMGRWLQWLPFASQASTPLRIYTGDTRAAPLLIGVQIGWSLILWPVTGLVWRRARERMISFGG